MKLFWQTKEKYKFKKKRYPWKANLQYFKLTWGSAPRRESYELCSGLGRGRFLPSSAFVKNIAYSSHVSVPHALQFSWKSSSLQLKAKWLNPRFNVHVLYISIASYLHWKGHELNCVKCSRSSVVNHLGFHFYTWIHWAFLHCVFIQALG